MLYRLAQGEPRVNPDDGDSRHIQQCTTAAYVVAATLIVVWLVTTAAKLNGDVTESWTVLSTPLLMAVGLLLLASVLTMTAQPRLGAAAFVRGRCLLLSVVVVCCCCLLLSVVVCCCLLLFVVVCCCLLLSVAFVVVVVVVVVAVVVVVVVC